MAKVNAKGEKYSEDNEKLAALATQLGWEVDDSRLYERGLIFKKGATRVWHCVSCIPKDHITSDLIWQVADVIDGRYCNHRPYNDGDLKKALTEN